MHSESTNIGLIKIKKISSLSCFPETIIFKHACIKKYVKNVNYSKILIIFDNFCFQVNVSCFEDVLTGKQDKKMLFFYVYKT